MIATTGLKGLRIDCIVGVYDVERAQRQPIIIDVDLDYDIDAAASSDDVDQAVDYDRVAQEVTLLIEQRQFRLIETMAEETARMLLESHSAVQTVRIEIRKPNAVSAADASFVRLERSRT